MNRSGRESWGAPRGQPQCCETEGTREADGSAKSAKLMPAKMRLGWKCEEACRKVCWAGLGAAGDVSQQRKERCSIGRCKCLSTYQLRTKESCDSKPVVLEELVVLHRVNLREGTDQRGGDPRIRSTELRLSPEALGL